MDTEQSTLRFLLPSDPPTINDHRPSEGVGTSSNSPPYGVEDVPSRMNSEPCAHHHYYQDNNGVIVPYIDNNDNSGTLGSEFISVEYISNCQEDSEIQLEESSIIDNNSNMEIRTS